VKTREPPYTEPYVRWCERTVAEIISYLLLDANNVYKLCQGGDAYACVGICILALIIKLKEEKHDRYRAISKNPGI
jgi:hypothetical protein